MKYRGVEMTIYTELTNGDLIEVNLFFPQGGYWSDTYFSAEDEKVFSHERTNPGRGFSIITPWRKSKEKKPHLNSHAAKNVTPSARSGVKEIPSAVRESNQYVLITSVQTETPRELRFAGIGGGFCSRKGMTQRRVRAAEWGWFATND